MSRGMTNAKWFVVTESTIREFEGVSEAIWMIQIKELPELFWRILEWETLDQWVKILEANKGVQGSRSGALPQVEEWLAKIKDN